MSKSGEGSTQDKSACERGKVIGARVRQRRISSGAVGIEHLTLAARPDRCELDGMATFMSIAILLACPFRKSRAYQMHTRRCSHAHCHTGDDAPGDSRRPLRFCPAHPPTAPCSPYGLCERVRQQRPG